MRTATDVSTDELVNSLLNSVTSTSSSVSSSSASVSSSSASASSSASHSETSSSSSASSGANVAPKTTTSPTTTSPTTTKPIISSSASSETATRGANDDDGSDDGGGGGGAALSIGIAIGVLALVVAALLFLRARRRRAHKGESAASPPAGATCLTVPADRGFKQERALGMPEMSIELPPGHLGFSKGFDMSYASSSARSSVASNSNNFSSSVASSTDSSVFNTQGGVSPTFSSRKMDSYSYQYRESSDGDNTAANSSQRSNGSTTFHLTGMIGNGNTASNRGANADSRGRKLSAPDEYAELVTATNAHGQMDMDADSSKNQPQELHADFTSQNRRSMGPDADNHSFLAPLPTSAPPMPIREPPVVRASEESMGPDSPVAGRGKRTGSVYDSLPKLSGEKMTTSFVRPSEDEDPRGMSTASFLSESSISSTSTRDSVATSARSSAYVASMPLLQQLSSAEDSDYGEDLSSERASTDSTDSGNMTRSGSLIAMNLDAKDGCSEIAI